MPKYQCKHCLDAMTFIEHKRSEYCYKAQCQRALGQSVAKRQEAKRKANHDHLINLHKAHQKGRPAIDVTRAIPVKLLDSIQQNHVMTAIVPDNSNQLTVLPKVRKQAFLNHLKALFNDIQTGKRSEYKVYAEQLEAPLSKTESTLLGKACATCRGYCCTWGGAHHAFQDSPSLQHYLSTQSARLSEDQLVDMYSQFIPKYSYQNACVFQGNLGCTLPSEMRSFTCNNYRCSSLNAYQQNITKSHSQLTYAAAVDNNGIKRTTIFDDENYIQLD